MAITIIEIEGFSPYRYHVPNRPAFVGSIKIRLPKVHIKVKDFAPLVPDAYIGGDMPGPAWDIEGIGEPGIPREKVIEFMEQSKDLFYGSWQLYQDKLDEAGPLLGSLL